MPSPRSPVILCTQFLSISLQVVELLLDNGSLLWRALHFATVAGSLAVLRHLLDPLGVPAGLQCGGTPPLAIAVAHGNQPLCSLLLCHGARVTAPLGADLTRLHGLRDGAHALHLAARLGNTGIVSELLQAVRPPADARAPKSGAHQPPPGPVADDDEEVFGIAALGVKPTLRPRYLDAVLWLRRNLCNPDTAELEQKLRDGADPNAQDPHGWAGLSLCAIGNNVAAARVFLRGGADAALESQYGFQAFMWAKWYDADGVAEALGQHRVDITRGRDHQGLDRLRAAFEGAGPEDRAILRCSVPSISASMADSVAPPGGRSAAPFARRLGEGLEVVGEDVDLSQVLAPAWVPEEWLETTLRDMDADGFELESPNYKGMDTMLTMCKLFVQRMVAAGESNLQPVAILALHLYTLQSNIFLDCNRAMRENDAPALTKWRVFIYHLHTALERLPTRSNTVFRGISNVDISACILQYREGNTIVWGSFTSSSASRKVATLFLDRSEAKTSTHQVDACPATCLAQYNTAH